MRLAAFSVSSALVFLFSNAPANAATCVPATADGAGLQACLDLSAPGDTVLLSPGLYVPTTPTVFPSPQGKTFGIGKYLTIKGTGPGVVLSGDLGAGLKAFNVVGITADAYPGPVTLENLTIQDGDSSDGGSFVGGGIVVADNQTVILNNVTVQNNAAVVGGGIWPGQGSSLTVHNSRFLDNTAVGNLLIFGLGGGGGAIAAVDTDLVIDASEFDANSAPDGWGGAIYSVAGGFQARNTTFTNNSGNESGGALTIQAVSFGKSYLIENCTFGTNAVLDMNDTEGFGGAIDLLNNIGEGRIVDSDFYGNTATLGGGAIYFTWGRATVEGSRFWENSSGFTGGAIGIQGAADGTRSTNVILEKNQLTDNSSLFGGAVLAFNISGGFGSSLTFAKNHYRRNSAGFGGAVFVADVDVENENVTMLKEHFDFNWADSAVGGLILENVVSGSIEKLYFNHNDANGAPHSLFVDNSPNLNIGKIKIAAKDADDCIINGDTSCP